MDLFSDMRGHRQPAPLARHYDAMTFDFLSMLWRRRLLIAAVTGGIMLVTALYLMVTPQRYTADLVLQFDFTREDSGGGGKASSVALDASTLVESEARIIRSLATARAVAARLGLDKETRTQSSGLLGGAAELIFPSSVRRTLRDLTGFGDAAEPTQRDIAAQRLLASLGVSNDTKAYLVTLTYRDTDPDRAALIVNAFGNEYLRRKMEATANASQRSSQWYGAQAQEARANLGRIEKEIEAFRIRTGFVELGQDGADIQQQ